MQFTWMNFVLPWHLQGVMKGSLRGSSSSSRQMRHILPLSRPKASFPIAAERPPVTTLG